MKNGAIENVTEVANDILKEDVTMVNNGMTENDIAVSTLVNELASHGGDVVVKSGPNPFLMLGIGVVIGVAGKILIDKYRKPAYLDDEFEPCEINEDEYDVEEAEDEE
jgi:hypothetical protein